MKLAEVSAARVREGVRRARTEGGAPRFIMAPGCSPAGTYAYPPLIRAVCDEARR
jgi:hypothetical protein